MSNVSLPLLDRVSVDGTQFLLTPSRPNGLVQLAPSPAPRLPERKPASGEQYRFHFDMTKCIGCKCCEVACNEQNNNPADLRWRRVGEIEGGEYPFAKRFYLSMGCNHCLDAACLKGCPVDAYRKDALSGLVLHSADACIGCQYCTWNCPYGVPQFNEERGVVGKCDMCYGRLSEGREPACVNACPQGAIQVELVNIAEWKDSFRYQANAPGMPPAETTISTTRITLPEAARGAFEKADYHRVQPEHPHWPLVVMLVLTQLSVGAFAAIWAFGVFGLPSKLAAVAALLAGHLALGASTLHLGRPIHAYRALKMWKRSWLSREVLSFSAFAGLATGYAGMLWLDLPGSATLGVATSIAGLLGILCSAFIYLVPARPAWNSWRTVAGYYLTAFLLGPLFAATFLGAAAPDALRWIAAGAGLAQLLNQIGKFVWLHCADQFELRQSGRLLAADLKRRFLLRLALLSLGAAAAVLARTPLETAGALALCLSAEMLGRYLFFVSVVPHNMAASFFGGTQEAA